jgi:hypothetical protein
MQTITTEDFMSWISGAGITIRFQELDEYLQKLYRSVPDVMQTITIEDFMNIWVLTPQSLQAAAQTASKGGKAAKGSIFLSIFLSEVLPKKNNAQNHPTTESHGPATWGATWGGGGGGVA